MFDKSYLRTIRTFVYQIAPGYTFAHIGPNESYLVNYGDRYRNKETISSAFVESTVNEVISKRFVKKQQMRWSKSGAHLLLQVRIKVLNEDWRSTFCGWYPGMKPAIDIGSQQKQAA